MIIWAFSNLNDFMTLYKQFWLIYFHFTEFQKQRLLSLWLQAYLSLLSFMVQPQLKTKPYTCSLSVDQLNLPFFTEWILMGTMLCVFVGKT